MNLPLVLYPTPALVRQNVPDSKLGSSKVDPTSVLSSRRYPNVSQTFPDSKGHRANMGPTWALSAPDGPHVGHMNLAIRGRLVNVLTETGTTGPTFADIFNKKFLIVAKIVVVKFKYSRIGANSLSEPMRVRYTDAYMLTRPWWVKVT